MVGKKKAETILIAWGLKHTVGGIDIQTTFWAGPLQGRDCVWNARGVGGFGRSVATVAIVKVGRKVWQ